MEFNKIAGAILLVGIAAMVISKIGDILLPETHFSVKDHAPVASTPSAPPKPDMTFAEAIAKADVATGKAQANKCIACHSLDKGGPNKVGPNLWDIVGRKKGSHEGYAYSGAMKGAEGNWTYEKLYEFLKNPQAVVKGTKMSYRMVRDDQRGAVIKYLQTLSDNPQPLPKFEPAADKKEEPKKEEPKKEEPKKDQ